VTVAQQLATDKNLTPGRVSQLKKQGCPMDSFERAVAWYESNVTGNRRARRRVAPTSSDPADGTAQGRVEQAHAMVERNYRLWNGAADAGQVREACELQKAYSLSCKDAVLAESDFLDWQKRVGALVEKTAMLAAFDSAFDSCLKRLHRDHPEAGKLVADACRIFSAKLEAA
jgi:hypothetical protein